jgi:hypothetical protein
MLSGCLLFVFVGSMLSFAPARFSEWMRWWAKRIHFPQRSNKETPDTSARKRVPGFALLCFGSFILYKVIHSLLLDISVSTPKASEAPLRHAVGDQTQYLTALFPIFFGFILFIRTDASFKGFQKGLVGRPNTRESLRPAKSLLE